MNVENPSEGSSEGPSSNENYVNEEERLNTEITGLVKEKEAEPPVKGRDDPVVAVDPEPLADIN